MEITLRQWTKHDTKELASLANNVKIWNNLRDRLPHPYTIKNAEDFIAFCLHQKPQQVFAIEHEKKFVGCVGLELKDDVYKCTAEIGYWIGEPYWGKGIATEAVRQIVDYIFETFGEIVRIYAEVFEYNQTSMKVLEKNGFHLESIRKDAVIKNGKVLSDYVWVRLRNNN
ncbi:MAG: GNAT family N-acetyltransferase [Bacteroidetes bacterium]|nr:MAG: GNAT family N-acetyltransferase [Bacteroidota bacterium]